MKNSDLRFRLRLAMEERDISQAQLSKLTGISKPTISNYLSGHHLAKTESLIQMSKALNVSEMWLAGYDCPEERVNDSMKTLSNKEQKVIIAYRMNPAFQDAVDKLLGVN